MKYVEEIRRGDVFVYPTDTIYGLGCDAFNVGAVERIQKIKGRNKRKPISVIAPSKDWVLEHCVVEEEVLDKYLPGPYTLILEKRDEGFLSHVAFGKKLGVRIVDCEFMKSIEEVGVPFVTTSVNLSGEPFAVDVGDVDVGILGSVDVVVDDGRLDGRPSTLVEDGNEIRR